MIQLNRKTFYDKVYGCWIGKSIGGTLGAPFEGKRALLDVCDFHSQAGRPLPNDDLDLQLIWLKALEDRGPKGINEQVLGEYWLNYIPPHWNEYGLAKSNMKAGILPPLSGDHENVWRHSNGAWIRTEIWACCAPGCPRIATRFAWSDACVDHGTGEGTYAALFMASVESAAFILSDREQLIQIGLSYIPTDCRVARSVRIALRSYQEGLDFKEARKLVIQDSSDLGWFQAPANVAFVIIGWLYGEGDFKKSLLAAINCGDDTDCTGATLGSILGIIQGASAIPEDWKKHVGDEIVTVAVDRGSLHTLPATCAELTERTMRMCDQVLAAFDAKVVLTDAEVNWPQPGSDWLMSTESDRQWLSERDDSLSFDFIHTLAKVQFPDGLYIKPGETRRVRITLKNQMPDPRHIELHVYLPDGWLLTDGPFHVNLPHQTAESKPECSFELAIQAGPTICASNRGVISMNAIGRPTPMLVPLLFLGQS